MHNLVHHRYIRLLICGGMKRLLFLCLLFAISIITAQTQSFKRDKSQARYAHFVKNPSMKLTSSLLADLKVTSIGQCTFECVNNPECYSVNFGQSLDGKHVCELINTDKYNQPQNLVASEEFHHYNIKTPCMENPCRNGGSCYPIYSQEDFNCVCPPNHAGKYCEILQCSGETLDICGISMFSWKATTITSKYVLLPGCDSEKIQRGYELLLFVSRGDLADYGKYDIVQVKEANSCNVTFTVETTGTLRFSSSHVIAQLFPNYDTVTLSNNCILTCRQQTAGIGGILALRSKTMVIDRTSKIQTTGQGFLGGQGGDTRGGGGYGGESFLQLNTGTNGKGGDIRANWAQNTDGVGGGGAGDGPSPNAGDKGGPGAYNAGGGGGDSTGNSDDGAGGGGGGGHFSGGGGGGGGNGCGYKGGAGGTASTLIGAYAGGGGQAACTGGNGGTGGQRGQWSLGQCSSAAGGEAGTASRGGQGGDSCGSAYGGGGGGGGVQFGNTDFKQRLSYGGGGGGGGGCAFSDDPHLGGRGGNGGGLVYLQLDELTLDGTIESNGEPGQCLQTNPYRSAPGGSGAGGSVVITAGKLNGNPNGRVLVSGGAPVNCAWGVGGGGGGGVGRWVIETKDSVLTSG